MQPVDWLAAPGLADLVIDARSPAEYAEDHLPGAVNWWVLDNDERRTVGTLYKQVSPLQARQVGAAMVARNIATHLEREMPGKSRDWRPMVYCWRGGQRSGSLAWFLGQIGFRATQLAGGYKAFRARVLADLSTLPETLDFRVLAARTGSGKTRLLHALAEAGAQVLDLEALACHRGSVLGGLPDRPQPTQKRFDTLVWQALRSFDPRRPVFVESESARIGRLTVPETLLRRMRERGHIVRVSMDDAARLQLLLQDYGHFAAAPESFCTLLDALVELRGKATVARWQAQARVGDWPGVFGELMSQHYDPLYTSSLRKSYGSLDALPLVELGDGSPETLRAVAQSLVRT